MSEPELSGDLRGVLQDFTVPSYVIDRAGVIRWLNPAAIELFGDVRGRLALGGRAAIDASRT